MKSLQQIREGYKSPAEEPLEEAKLPPHLAKFFDKKGNMKPEVAQRVAKGQEKLNIKQLMGKDVAPKGYGVKESLEENFAVHKNGKQLKIKGKEVTARSKEAAQKAIDTMMKQPFNKDAKFTVVQTDDKKKSAPAGAVKPRTTSDKEWKMAEIRRKHRSMPAWRRAERGE